VNHRKLRVAPGTRVRLGDYDSADTGRFRSKDDAAKKLASDIERLAALQDVLYAQGSTALLLIFQAMDAAGKDGVIKHVMSGVNPQGCQVYSFKTPSAEELSHDFLWRTTKSLPEKGRIGIFNRSYYEEVLVVRVHPELLRHQKLADAQGRHSIWEQRFEDINAMERHLARNGTVILKFFLHVSSREQKRRFLDRIDTPAKNWKFSGADVKERMHWKEYMQAYEDALSHTSTAWAPWYIIPADHKWYTRVAVADVIVSTLDSLNLKYPALDREHRKGLMEAKAFLEGKKSRL
jgi:PPK2 family polyphosphate:nucleotide phosphotransferase